MMDHQANQREALGYLEELRIMIEDAKGAFGNRGSCQIDRERALDLISDVTSALPGDLAKAGAIARKVDDIYARAEGEADRIIDDARRQAEILASEQEVVRIAQVQADAIVADAEDYARSIRQGANDYADDVFEHLEREMDGWIRNVRSNRSLFVDTTEN